MGVIFEHDGVAIWEPSLRLGFLFVGQIRAIEQVLELASGIGDIVHDECQVDPAPLGRFLLTLDQQIGSGFNETMSSLLAGCFAVAAGLHAACRPSEPLELHPRGAALQRRGELLVSGRTRAAAVFVDLKLED